MPPDPAIYLCMGSACHQRGTYDLLPLLRQLLDENGLAERVPIKGSFCLGPCKDGVVLKYRHRLFTHLSTDNLPGVFSREILPAIQREEGL